MTRRNYVRHARTDTPPANVVLGVWYVPEQREIAAYHDGTVWRARDGEVLAEQPTHWYAEFVGNR